MLCSKPAKQPEGWASLGSSYVMKHLRLVLILALVAAVAAACGGGGGAPKSVPSDAVAVVGNDTISKDRFNEVLADAKRSYQATHKPFPKPLRNPALADHPVARRALRVRAVGEGPRGQGQRQG